MEAIAIFFFCVLFVLIGAVALMLWATYVVVRAVVRLVTPKPKPLPVLGAAAQVCANGHCNCTNPPYARFCRRCGKSLPSLLRTITSRVAML